MSFTTAHSLYIRDTLALGTRPLEQYDNIIGLMFEFVFYPFNILDMDDSTKTELKNLNHVLELFGIQNIPSEQPSKYKFIPRVTLTQSDLKRAGIIFYTLTFSIISFHLKMITVQQSRLLPFSSEIRFIGQLNSVVSLVIPFRPTHQQCQIHLISADNQSTVKDINIGKGQSTYLQIK